ncbi:MAG TPA: ATP-binding protein [Opitutaceae bacterium]|nr:ATP-binding protein [Opitutaceae bacterium]
MTAKAAFDPRKLMEQAIEVMRRSVHEPRAKEGAAPLVGAVLVKPDGSVDTAGRGELREGDHAEFTLLERKNRAARLDGSVLFTTLEPCAPGARAHPKPSCAERIAAARIAEIWVGIEDPDPTVDRKGIKYLQDHGVAVHLFDRDLQEVIREANHEFITQALERKPAAAEKKGGMLSSLEGPAPRTDGRDLSRAALDAYRAAAGIADPVDSAAFRRRLLQQGLLREERDKVIPSGFGLLLFGEAPRQVLPQAGLLGTIHFPDGTEELRDFDGPQVFAPEQALAWLRDKLPNPVDRSEARRREINDALFELAREGIVNALVHRDYGIEGAKCQLTITPDTLVVKSPGGPVKPITLEQLQSFSAPMLSRNPLLHYVFAKLELAEERGLGLKSMRARATEARLPLPKYSWDDPYLVLTLYRSAEASTHLVAKAALGALSNMELVGWAFLSTRTDATQGEYARHLGVNARTAQRHLTHFVELGLLRRTGQARATRYQVIGP